MNIYSRSDQRSLLSFIIVFVTVFLPKRTIGFIYNTESDTTSAGKSNGKTTVLALQNSTEIDEALYTQIARYLQESQEPIGTAENETLSPTEDSSFNQTGYESESPSASPSDSLNETESDWPILGEDDEDFPNENSTNIFESVAEEEDVIDVSELANDTISEVANDTISEDTTELGVDWEYENILALRWKLLQESVSYDGLRFDVHFTVSDYIERDLVGFELYDGPACSGGANRITDEGFFRAWISDDGTPKGPGLEVKQLTLSSEIVPENITRSEAYEEIDDQARVEFCVRLNLYSQPISDSSATLINKYETSVKLVVDLRDEFAIQSQVVEAMDEGRETAGDEFFVEAFICDKDGRQILDSITFVQGQEVKVCIKPTQQALDIGFRMRGIDRFTFWQGYVSQEAIINGAASINGLTESNCEAGIELCSFSTLLNSYFFQGPSTVAGDGLASLQFKGSRRNRRLGGTKHSSIKHDSRDLKDRRLQSRAKTVELNKFQIQKTTSQALISSGASSGYAARNIFLCLSTIIGTGTYFFA